MSFAISIHPFIIGRDDLDDEIKVKYHATQVAEGYEVLRTNSMAEIAEYVMIYCWSPIVFNGGKRKEECFSSCNMMALDFDKKKDVDDAFKEFGRYMHFIGYTKSHSDKCHKFRVLIPFDGKFVSVFDYKYVMKYLTVKYGADRSCSDAARFYFPCVGSGSLQGEKGELMPRAVPVKSQAPIENYNFTYDKRHVPAHIKRFISQGQLFGAGRNQSCFIAALHLKKAGYSEAEILHSIKSGAGPRIIGDDFSLAELEKAVKNGYARIS